MTVLPSASAQDAVRALTGTWRFTHALPAPWGAPASGSTGLQGSTLRLASDLMQGPPPLNCRTPAHLEASSLPAQGLFQGNLPAPAEDAAQALGLSAFPVQGLSVTCDQGRFEFHQADADTLLLGLDNRVWTLSRAAGTRAPKDSPAGRVQTFLEQHFAAPPGGDEASAAAQSRRLNQLFQTYLARPRSPDQVPPIDGDPYTDSQEPPTRFAVGTARLRHGRARVPVELADAWSRRVITYELVREAGAWRVDDLDDGHGERLSTWLRQ